MLRVREEAGRIRVGSRFSFRLERTLRVPDDGRKYPLPPTFGAFPLFLVQNYASRFPAALRQESHYFIPVRQWEALWLSFQAAHWKPNAVQVSCGGVNALTGEQTSRRLKARPQNYIVCPEQPWLDGFKTGHGVVRQFVAAPLGRGLTVAEQLQGSDAGGLAVRVIEPKPGIFPDRPRRGIGPHVMLESMACEGMEFGLGAGGVIEQQVYPDPYGLATWDSGNDTSVTIALLNSAMFRKVTGQDPPQSTISAAEYSRLGFPWFKLYEEDGASDMEPAKRLENVNSLGVPDEPAAGLKVKPIRRSKRRSGAAARVD